MAHAIEFIETTFFTKQIDELATDNEIRALQNELIAQPDKGRIIEGTGGLRKLRMATEKQDT